MMLPVIVQAYLDAYNRQDVAALVSYVAEDIVFENVSNTGGTTRIEGQAAFAELAAGAAAMFAVRRQTVRTAIVEGERVALEIDWTGVPAMDLGDMPAGRRVALRGASFFTLAHGKLTRIVDLS